MGPGGERPPPEGSSSPHGGLKASPDEFAPAGLPPRRRTGPAREPS
jgi:hypothetical protein